MSAKIISMLEHKKNMNWHSLSDEELMKSFQDGKEAAFNEIVKRYKDRLVNFLYYAVGNRYTAEDLAQETFLRVYRHSHNFDTKRKFSVWIYVIAKNLSKNALRDQYRRFYIPLVTTSYPEDETVAHIDVPDNTKRPDVDYERNEIDDCVRQCIQQLPENFRTALILRDLEELIDKEIAEVLKI